MHCACRIAATRGWDLRFAPQQAEPLAVPIRIVPSPMPPVDSTETGPLQVSMRALELPELQDLLVQRDVERRRQALVSGIHLLLLHAEQRKFKRGTGYWFAPHLWFVAGMSRDTEEESTGDGGVMMQLVGPVYTKVFPRPARHHFYSMMQAFEVDLIYIEDGLKFEDVRRVLLRLFAHYDDASGPERLEDSHLTGLSGVRAIVYDFELQDPFKKKGYPEPDYEDLGRARILHVFRDRGEDDEIPEIPIDLDGLLVPVT